MKDYYIYNDIEEKRYEDQVCSDSKSFVQFMNENKDSEITLHINTYGGEVKEAEAFVNRISTHPKKVTAIIEGVAASCGSWIALSCNDIFIFKNAEIMIHRVAMFNNNFADADDLTELAKELLRYEVRIIEVYKNKAIDMNYDFLEAMKKETVFKGYEAVDVWNIELIDNENINNLEKTKYVNIAKKCSNYKPKTKNENEKKEIVDMIELLLN